MSGIVDSQSITPQPPTRVIETVPRYDSTSSLPSDATSGDQAIVGGNLYTYEPREGWLPDGEYMPLDFDRFTRTYLFQAVTIAEDFTAKQDSIPTGFA